MANGPDRAAENQTTAYRRNPGAMNREPGNMTPKQDPLETASPECGHRWPQGGNHVCMKPAGHAENPGDMHHACACSATKSHNPWDSGATDRGQAHAYGTYRGDKYSSMPDYPSANDI